MATKKKKIVNHAKIAYRLSDDVSSVLFDLYELQDETFGGNITNKDLILGLFEVCHKLESALSDYEKNTDED